MCPSRVPTNTSSPLRCCFAGLQLLAYRLGNYDPAPALEKLEGGLREVILHMIRKDPSQRLPAAGYLQVPGSRGARGAAGVAGNRGAWDRGTRADPDCVPALRPGYSWLCCMLCVREWMQPPPGGRCSSCPWTTRGPAALTVWVCAMLLSCFGAGSPVGPAGAEHCTEHCALLCCAVLCIACRC